MCVCICVCKCICIFVCVCVCLCVSVCVCVAAAVVVVVLLVCEGCQDTAVRAPHVCGSAHSDLPVRRGIQDSRYRGGQ